jgi:hypothetical protein
MRPKPFFHQLALRKKSGPIPCNFQKAAQSKQPPNGRKSVQSGHPAKELTLIFRHKSCSLDCNAVIKPTKDISLRSALFFVGKAQPKNAIVTPPPPKK